MAITATCPKCGKSGQVPDQALDKKVKCKGCQTVFPIEKRQAPPESDGSKPVILVGDAQAGLKALATQLRREGIPVGEVNQVADGLPVLFCVSCTDGPMPATGKAVQACADRSVVPLGLIGLNASMVDDPELLELMAMEVRALLEKTAPLLFTSVSVDDLPWFRDDEKGLAAKVGALILAPPKTKPRTRAVEPGPSARGQSSAKPFTGPQPAPENTHHDRKKYDVCLPGAVVPEDGWYQCECCGDGVVGQELYERTGVSRPPKQTVAHFRRGTSFPNCRNCDDETIWSGPIL